MKKASRVDTPGSLQNRDQLLFLSHSSADNKIVRRMARDLESAGIAVWVDLDDLQIGSAIPLEVSTAIDRCSHFAFLASENSLASRWAQEELQMAWTKALETGLPEILPVLLDSSPMPRLIQHKKYADFRESYSVGYQDLVGAICGRNRTSGEESESPGNLKNLLKRTLRRCSTLPGAHAVHILMRVRDSHAERLAMIGTLLHPGGQRFLYAAMDGIIGRAFRDGEQVVINDVLQDPDYKCGELNTRSELATPIIGGRHQVLGVINVESTRAQAFARKDCDYMQGTAEEFARWWVQFESEAPRPNRWPWVELSPGSDAVMHVKSPVDLDP